MTVYFGTSVGNKAIANGFIGSAAGNKQILFIYAGSATGNKVVWSSLSASAAPADFLVTSATTGLVITGNCTVTVTNGIGPYTYTWHITTTSGNTISVGSPTSAVTNFSANVTVLNPSSIGVAYCTVVDTGTGLTVNTNNVTLELDYVA